MIQIKNITTVEELYRNRGQQTGDIILDALVEALMKSNTHRAEDLSLMLGISQRTLTEVLQLLVGVTLRELIRVWRMQQAVELLAAGTMTDAEVARRSGYSSPKMLDKALRQYHGTTLYTYHSGKIMHNATYAVNATPEKRRERLRRTQQLVGQDDS